MSYTFYLATPFRVFCFACGSYGTLLRLCAAERTPGRGAAAASGRGKGEEKQ
jgi:hypothetical protein